MSTFHKILCESLQLIGCQSDTNRVIVLQRYFFSFSDIITGIKLKHSTLNVYDNSLYKVYCFIVFSHPLLLLKLRLHYNELAQRTATVWRYLTVVAIRWYTLKKSDEYDHWGLTYRTENEFQTTPERTHNILVANDKRVSTTPQRTPNVLRVLSACPLRTLCEQCAYRL